MTKIYKDQENLRIRLTTGVNITNATVKQIKYEKPDETTGFWNAEVDDVINGIIYYDVKITENGADIDQVGIWKFWAWITFSDDRSAPGEVVRVRVYTEGA